MVSNSWWGHEKSKVLENGKITGLNIVTGFTDSQKLSWMNSQIIVLEVSGSVTSEEFTTNAYEWS